MIGGIVGDFIGSEFEHQSLKTFNILELTSARSKITDESIMLAATASALINDRPFEECFMNWGHTFNNIEFGPSTSHWLAERDINYVHESFSNGAAARCGIIGTLDIPLSQILELATDSARCTHNHQEGINGAKAVCYVVWAVRHGKSKEEIYDYLISEFGYLMYYTFEGLKRSLTFDTSAENSIPPAIFLALESRDWEDCMRLCLYAAGTADTDTIMSVASLIKSQTHPITPKYVAETKKWLFKHYQPVLQMIVEFEAKRWMCKLPI
jgi:ADP-ribosyl-[dinitrogen reductase] hydrolase